MKTIPFWVALAIAVVGCGDGDGGSSPTTSTAGPLVAYTKTGGVAGVNEHLAVKDDGSAILEVGYQDPARQRFDLDAEGLDHLRELLAAADFAGVDPGPGIGCADCFQYEIEYEGSTTAFAEIGDIPQSVGDVVAELGRIVEAHAPTPAPPG